VEDYMRTELKQSEIIYNFNTDYDDSDQSYCFILMTEHKRYFFQILLNYSISRITILIMKSNGTSKISVDHGIPPRSINLSPHEISNLYEIKKAINELIGSVGCSSDELHSYISSNLDEFLKQLLQDAQSRGLIKISDCVGTVQPNHGCFTVVILGFIGIFLGFLAIP
jgi:hypothetical protein